MQNPETAKNYYMNDRNVLLFETQTEQSFGDTNEHLFASATGAPHEDVESCITSFRVELRDILKNFSSFLPRDTEQVTLIWRNDLQVFQVLNGRHRLLILYYLILSGCRCMLSDQWPSDLDKLLKTRLTFTILCNDKGDFGLVKANESDAASPAVSLFSAARWVVANSSKENSNVKRSDDVLLSLHCQEHCLNFYSLVATRGTANAALLVMDEGEQHWLHMPSPAPKALVKSLASLDNITRNRSVSLVEGKTLPVAVKACETLVRLVSAALLSDEEFKTLPDASKWRFGKFDHVDLAVAVEKANDLLVSASLMTKKEGGSVFYNQLAHFRFCVPLGFRFQMSIPTLASKLMSWKNVASSSQLVLSREKRAQYALANFICKEHMYTQNPQLFGALGSLLAPLPPHLETVEPWFAFFGLRLTSKGLSKLADACLRFKEGTNFVLSRKTEQAKATALDDWAKESLKHLDSDGDEILEKFPGLFAAIVNLRKKFTPAPKEVSAVAVAAADEPASKEPANKAAAAGTETSKTTTPRREEGASLLRMLATILEAKQNVQDDAMKEVLTNLADKAQSVFDQNQQELMEEKEAPPTPPPKETKKARKKTKPPKVEVAQLDLGIGVVSNESFSGESFLSIDGVRLAATGFSVILWAPSDLKSEEETSALQKVFNYHSLDERDCYVGIFIEAPADRLGMLVEYANRSREQMTVLWAAGGNTKNTISSAHVYSTGTTVGLSFFLLSLYRCSTKTSIISDIPEYLPQPSTLVYQMQTFIPHAHQRVREQFLIFFAESFRRLSFLEVDDSKIHGMLAVVAPSISFSSAHHSDDESHGFIVLDAQFDQFRCLFYGNTGSCTYTPPAWQMQMEEEEEEANEGKKGSASSSTPQQPPSKSKGKEKLASPSNRTPRSRGNQRGKRGRAKKSPEVEEEEEEQLVQEEEKEQEQEQLAQEEEEEQPATKKGKPKKQKKVEDPANTPGSGKKKKSTKKKAPKKTKKAKTVKQPEEEQADDEEMLEQDEDEFEAGNSPDSGSSSPEPPSDPEDQNYR